MSKTKLVNGIKLMAITLPLMFLGPFILTIGFKALNDGNYVWLVIGIILSLLAIVLAFMGIRTILIGLFEKE